MMVDPSFRHRRDARLNLRRKRCRASTILELLVRRTFRRLRQILRGTGQYGLCVGYRCTLVCRSKRPVVVIYMALCIEDRTSKIWSDVMPRVATDAVGSAPRDWLIQVMRQLSWASSEQAQAFDHRDGLTSCPFADVSPSSTRQIQHFFFSEACPTDPSTSFCRLGFTEGLRSTTESALAASES